VPNNRCQLIYSLNFSLVSIKSVSVISKLLSPTFIFISVLPQFGGIFSLIMSHHKYRHISTIILVNHTLSLIKFIKYSFNLIQPDLAPLSLKFSKKIMTILRFMIAYIVN